MCAASRPRRRSRSTCCGPRSSQRAATRRRSSRWRPDGCPRSRAPVSSRRQARRTALILLYQWDLTGQELGTLYLEDIDPFALELARPVVAAAPALDARITEAAEGWTADRLGVVERNVLRLAISELDRGEAPREVVIAEAVALAKRHASPHPARPLHQHPGRNRGGEGG